MLPWLTLTVSLQFLLCILAYYYLTSKYQYWKERNVAYEKPYPIVGSMYKVMTVQQHMISFFQDVYKKYENEPYVGYFQATNPALMIRDPELIKNILVKDFTHFIDHGFKIHEDADPLQAKNLFAMEGKKWREMRSKLTPTFTSGRIKCMFPLVLNCAQELEDYLNSIEKNKPFEFKDILARYNTDVIASCAFGFRSDAIKNPDCEFRVMGRKLLEMGFWRGLKTLIILFAPEISLRLRLRIMSEEITCYLRNMVKNVMELRAKTGIIRHDFMNLLIQLKDKGYLSPEEGEDNNELCNQQNDMKLTDDDVTAQAAVFFLAGFETSSTVMSFALLELAMNPDVQKKAHEEIDDVINKYNGEITYECMQEMKYLECIIQESMRKYPPTNALIRVCTKNYNISETNLKIEKGTQIIIPIHAIQNDPKYFNEPEKFIPERFTNMKEIKSEKQFIHMPFGEGPRQCIGYRFAKMQSKLGLLAVLKKFNVDIGKDIKYPVEFDPKTPIPQPKEKFWLKLNNRI